MGVHHTMQLRDTLDRRADALGIDEPLVVDLHEYAVARQLGARVCTATGDAYFYRGHEVKLQEGLTPPAAPGTESA